VGNCSKWNRWFYREAQNRKNAFGFAKEPSAVNTSQAVCKRSFPNESGSSAPQTESDTRGRRRSERTTHFDFYKSGSSGQGDPQIILRPEKAGLKI